MYSLCMYVCICTYVVPEQDSHSYGSEIPEQFSRDVQQNTCKHDSVGKYYPYMYTYVRT